VGFEGERRQAKKQKLQRGADEATKGEGNKKKLFLLLSFLLSPKDSGRVSLSDNCYKRGARSES